MKWSNFFGGKRSKYGNQKVTFDGQTFDSKKEYQRYLVLKNAESECLISNLRCQVQFELEPAVVEEYEEQLKTKTVTRTRVLQRAMHYTCDFCYDKDGNQVVEDVKGSEMQAKRDTAYQLRKKLLFARFRIRVKEVYKANAEI